MSIAILQTNPRVGNFVYNLETLSHIWPRNKHVCLPYGAISGYLSTDLRPTQDFFNACQQHLIKLSQRFPYTQIITALPVLKGSTWHPRPVVAQNGYLIIAENDALAVVIENRPWLACTDCPENLPADFIHLNPLPYSLHYPYALEKKLSSLAKNNVIAPSLYGGHDEYCFTEPSFIIHHGKLIRANYFQDDTLTLDADAHRQISKLDYLDLLTRTLIYGIRDYAQKNSFTQIILGLSGGIDSALTATLATQALGPENILAISIPSRYSSAATRNDAQKQAQKLKIKFREIPLTDVWQYFNTSMTEALGPGPEGVEQENLQARIRGSILMTLSNKHGQLVLGTSNRSETMVGYCTLYGDMVAGLAPLADLYKTEVYELSEYFNTKEEIILRSIIDRAHSAELRPDQTDQDYLPPYSMLDAILIKITEDDFSFADLIQQGFEPAMVTKVFSLMNKSQYKRYQAAPRLKLRNSKILLPLNNQYLPSLPAIT